MRVVRHRLRREVVRRIAAHLVEVDEHQRVPLLEHAHSPERLGLGERDPIAVEVEEVVVGATARPSLVVLGRQPIEVWSDAVALREVLDEAVAAIRVLGRVDQHQHVLADGVDHRVALRRQQVIGGEHRGIRRGDLVPVDAVGEPDHRRQRGHQSIRFVLGGGPRVGERAHAGADLLQPGEVARRTDRDIDERAALPGARVLPHANPIGCRSLQRFEVTQDLLRRRDGAPRLESEHRLESGDRGVVARVGPERLVGARRRASAAEEQRGESSDRRQPAGARGELHIWSSRSPWWNSRGLRWERRGAGC